MGSKVASAALAFLASAGIALSGAALHTVQAGGPAPANHQALVSQSMSLPLFFEPNQGQTASTVKFLAHGAGYGLFLTADEAVLEFQRPAASAQPSDPGSRLPVTASATGAGSAIRMRLDGANRNPRISGTSPLHGRSNYFVGNDPSKWRHDVPQFARVRYRSIYRGVDLIYYGNQGQLEYDFRIAPGADPKQIALSFQGAAARIDSHSSGDLILSTVDGEVRFHAPRIYQPATSPAGDSAAASQKEKVVAGRFRQLAGNRIGFAIADYDHSRELVIDPTLSYATYLGGTGNEGLVQVAVDSAGLIYLAGSTTSTYFFPYPAVNINNPPIQHSLNGAQNIFIAVINPALLPPITNQELVFATYLGGSGTDNLAGLAVDSSFSIYIAGSTNSTDFPTTSNGFQSEPSTTGVYHGFLSKISNVSNTQILTYGLSYSTYIGGNGTDNITGLAIDPSCTKQSCDAYLTGNTTSTNPASDYFPANPNGYQLTSNAPVDSTAYPQFFASKINTTGSGKLSMLYSTYFGGGFPPSPTVVGGGIAVDASGNMYFDGTTNMLPGKGPNGEAGFPLFNAQQACLNDPSAISDCIPATSKTDGFVAKINPNQPGFDPVYSTYIGGGDNDTAVAIAVDSSSNVYVTGSTFSNNWTSAGVGGFQAYAGGGDAYIAKIGPLSGSTYPLNYFTYLGGSGFDTGNAIQVDSLGYAHVAGSTTSSDLPVTSNKLQGYGGGGDAFVALISTTLAGVGAGDYLTYVGGGGLDQGTGIAIDSFGAAYIAGNTSSADFPVTSNAYQPAAGGGSDAFVTKVGAISTLVVTASAAGPSPNPVAAGAQVVFTFNVTNANPLGTDPANHVIFTAQLSPTTGFASSPTATITSQTGTCNSIQSDGTITCVIQSLAVNSVATIEVNVTPSASTSNVLTELSVSGTASANGGASVSPVAQTVNVVDFTVSAALQYPTITAGNPDTVQVNFCPTPASQAVGGYSGTITPTQTTAPSMVTGSTPTFSPTSVTLAGSVCQTTTLLISTVARPVNSGSLRRRGLFYATWLPVGGLSLFGLGLGAFRKRRRWICSRRARFGSWNSSAATRV